ncbi:MAG: hypothetical protein MHM6MM_009499 [Cercozoa sp. M6MM]
MVTWPLDDIIYLTQLWLLNHTDRSVDQTVDQTDEHVDIMRFLNSPVSTLSRAQVARLSMMRAIALEPHKTRPSVILLDEVTSSLTLDEERQFFADLRRFLSNALRRESQSSNETVPQKAQKQGGTTVIIVNHRTETLNAICDHVVDTTDWGAGLPSSQARVRPAVSPDEESDEK